MTVTELLKAHGVTTQDEADELLLKLAQDRQVLLDALIELARRCDGDEGMQPQGYNMSTIAAWAAVKQAAGR